jgi:ABC-type proline/glycine betaine transport system substrate-binding protein
MQPTAGGDEESIAYIYLDDGDAITTAEFADAHPEAMDLLEGAGLELDVVDALMSPARHRAPEIW